MFAAWFATAIRLPEGVNPAPVATDETSLWEKFRPALLAGLYGGLHTCIGDGDCKTIVHEADCSSDE